MFTNDFDLQDFFLECVAKMLVKREGTLLKSHSTEALIGDIVN